MTFPSVPFEVIDFRSVFNQHYDLNSECFISRKLSEVEVSKKLRERIVRFLTSREEPILVLTMYMVCY